MSRILVVEDDVGFRTLLETMIKIEGHEVHLAADGSTGLAQARNRKPEILISDIDMPGINGIDLVRQVRELPEVRDAYVIMLTGQGGQDAKLDALRAGADDFLEKPSSRQEILGRLEIAQKVMAVQRQQRDAEARAAASEGAARRTTDELDGIERAIAAAEHAMANRDVAALGTALRHAKDACARARAAGEGAAPAASGGSWL